VASSRELGALFGVLLGMLVPGCSVGHGEGEIYGEVSIDDCRVTTRYQMQPSAFFAQSIEELLRIRVQRGSDLEVRSDGLAVLVEDAALVKRSWLDRDIDVAAEGAPRIDLSLFLNESCPPGRDHTPVVLSAVSGTIQFADIYAPEVDDDDVRIQAEFKNLRFEDPRDTARNAVLNGYFDFLYVRGSPAQRFP
jgi:hypothetical protein